MRLTGWILAALTLVPLAGCASLTDFHYEQTQRCRARGAWYEHGAATMPTAYGHDYRAGWKDGFYDVATGGKGCPPVVAPCRYWHPAQTIDHCDGARHAYYSGFQDGVAAALQYPDTHYLKLWSSCECPLPVCENRCCPAPACCPDGLIVQDEIIEMPMEVIPETGVQQPISAPEASGGIHEATPYSFDSDQVQSHPVLVPATQLTGSTEAAPVAEQRKETGAWTIEIEAAQPYHFDASNQRELLLPMDGSPGDFPGLMIDEDSSSVAPCTLLQYAP